MSKLPNEPDIWDGGGTIPLPETDIPATLTEQRQKICESCESFKAFICTECNCFIPLKIRLKSSSCPIDKW